MDYGLEQALLFYALEGRSEEAREALRELDTDHLDALIDALDWLAAYADAETIRRAEKRP